MYKKHLWYAIGICLFFLVPEEILAQGAIYFSGSDFETRMSSFTSKLVTILLPVCSILGLIYACILALIGDGAAKQRIIMVIAASAIGFLAPVIIPWIKSIAGY